MKDKIKNIEEQNSEIIQTSLGQKIIPTDQELLFTKKCRHQILSVKYAIKVLKFDSRNINMMTGENSPEYREGYRTVCNIFDKQDFLLHIQVKEGTKFSKTQLKFIEDIQIISESPFLCIYESSIDSSSDELRKVLKEAIKNNPTKEVIPVFEVSTNLPEEKVAVLTELGIKKCAVIYRNYKRHELAWKEIMGLLESFGIFKFVFGVQPRMRKNNKASLLLAPLRYGANAVAHGLPWSGGKPSIRLLDNWVYKSPAAATKGATNYENQTRIQIENSINKFDTKYQFSRVDALNEANSLIPNLTIKQIKTLLY